MSRRTTTAVAALPVTTGGVGVCRGDPAVRTAVGASPGRCATPMAADVDIVPARRGLPDKNAGIRVRWPTAVAPPVVHVGLLNFPMFR